MKFGTFRLEITDAEIIAYFKISSGPFGEFCREKISGIEFSAEQIIEKMRNVFDSNVASVGLTFDNFDVIVVDRRTLTPPPALDTEDPKRR